MKKRERIERSIAGEQTDRVPVALWRYWPGDDQRAADLAQAVLAFQENYDWDFINVMPSNTFLVMDYGIQDQWNGDLEGTRECQRAIINRSLDWTDLRALDPYRGALSRHLESLRLIESGLNDKDTPIIQTIFNPLAQAQLIAGNKILLRHMRTNPDRVHTGLNTLTETTLRFIESLKRMDIDGIFYVTPHADYDMMSVEEYQAFGLPYDHKILDSLPSRWWLNVLNVGGEAPMFKLVDGFNVHIINWQDQHAEPDLSRGKSLVRGAVAGGLSPLTHILKGTPASVREAAREAIHQTNGRRLLLSAGAPIYISTPLSNIHAVREAVNVAGV
ncbi:MAG: hypothetical protein K8L99_07875 [Anaerolineae bacterium]|nr:hypothetical protein [Anaerolineae bacterium]